VDWNIEWKITNNQELVIYMINIPQAL
jgi:hypothetical protein